MRLGLRSIVLAVAGCGCAAAAVGAGACVVAPPPELPPAKLHRPTILHGSVQPPADYLLSAWPPGDFIVPVQLEDPSESFVWDVYVDYNGDPTSRPELPIGQPPALGPPDGGISLVQFRLPPDYDLSLCHRIEMLVGHGNDVANGVLYHSFDSVGYDSIVWFYIGPGGPGGCFQYDAGALQDGAFFPASSDGLAQTPAETGAGP